MKTNASPASPASTFYLRTNTDYLVAVPPSGEPYLTRRNWNEADFNLANTLNSTVMRKARACAAQVITERGVPARLRGTKQIAVSFSFDA